MRSFVTLFLAGMLSTAIHAEVFKSDSDGFIVEHGVTVAFDKARVFDAMTGKVGRWWNPDHSFSGDAGNMSIDSRCFCERWGDNLVHHLDTSMWLEGVKVVMQGGLGPLKELGLSGVMVWSLEDAGESGTMITWKYFVHGFSDTDLDALSAAVDGVLVEQLGRLVAFLDEA